MTAADRVIRWTTAGAVVGVAATLAANVAHGLGYGPSGAVVAETRAYRALK